MEGKKEIKVSLGTVICIFIILVLIVALAGMYFYYNNKLDFNNEEEIFKNIATNINNNLNDFTEIELESVKTIKPVKTINKLFKNANEAEAYIGNDEQNRIKFYEQEITIGDAILSGLVYESKASSTLKEESESYSIENISNFYTENCWCEGVEGDGIGEIIEINTFDSCEKVEMFSSNRSMKSIDDTINYLLTDYNTEGGRTGTEITKDNISSYYSEINQIAIINGYAKDDTLWENNNRVKKLKLTIDDTNQFILELEDTKDLQLFDINYKNDNITKKINMKFEILEVYQGEKYDDTCITSIYLSGGSNVKWGGR